MCVEKPLRATARLAGALARLSAALAWGLLLAALVSSSLDADVWAQSRSGAKGAQSKPRLRIRDRGRGIAFVEQGRAHALDLGDKVSAARIEDAGLLFESRQGAFTYLLIDVCGTSKYRPDDRHCGAGRECDLLWVKLDSRGKIVDAKSERYESCWLPITSEDGPKVEGRRLLLKLDDLREWVRKEVGYDADRPEEGLSLKSSPIPKDSP